MKMNFFFYVLILGICLGTLIYSCSKKGEKELVVDNSEVVLYDKTKLAKTNTSSDVNTSDVFRTDRIQKITHIDKSNQIFKDLENDAVWADVENAVNLDNLAMSEAKKYYFSHTKAEVIIIPVDNRTENIKNFLMIFTYNNKFLVAKGECLKRSDGFGVNSLKDLKGNIYFQYEINKENKIGNFRIKSAFPINNVLFPESFSKTRAAVQSSETLGNCSNKPWSDCMQCMLIEHCGSNWVCTSFCGILAGPECFAAAALLCASPSTN